MSRTMIKLVAIVATGLFASAGSGCATGYALANPDSNPNRIFAGTRISAAHDPSSLIGDVLVLPITGTQTLVNAATGKFRTYEEDRERANAAWELEQRRPPTASMTSPDPDPRTGRFTSFTVKFTHPITGFDPYDLTLTRDGAPIPFAAILRGHPSEPRSYLLTIPPDSTSTPGHYVLTLAAGQAGIKSIPAGQPLGLDATFAWNQ